MSTNFYARSSETPPDEVGLHIGKHSGGWEFMFRSHPGLENIVSWRSYLAQSDVHIVAESGYSVDLSTFWADATKRPAEVGGQTLLKLQWKGKSNFSGAYRDEYGYPFLDVDFC